MDLLNWDLELQTVREGYDGKSGWFQPRIAMTPQGKAILTMTPNQLWGSDIFSAIQMMRSDDLGRTWSDPQPQAELDRHTLPDQFDTCPCDMTPRWHAASGQLLATGHTAIYSPGPNGHVAVDNLHRRDPISGKGVLIQLWSGHRMMAPRSATSNMVTSCRCLSRGVCMSPR